MCLPQIDQLKKPTTAPHIVVGTPGRTLDLIRQRALSLKFVKHFILDECDRMLEDLGASIHSLDVNYSNYDYNLALSSYV